jgi:hypothetical protein
MTIYCVAGIALATVMHAQAQHCKVDVYVSRLVPVRASMLSDAKKKATAIFGEIGVKLLVRDGLPTADRSGFCGAPIVIQLDNSAGDHGHEKALAYALPYEQSGTCIHVFVDRVLSLDPVRLNRDPIFANILLAHVLAHEIAHVLEQSFLHSEEGLMKADWSARDFQRMEHHMLPFSPEDVERIRHGIAVRVAGTAPE